MRLDDTLGELHARPYRVVEGQHVVSTRRLVDSSAEQEVLEELIEGVKPPFPDEPGIARLHYLLSTPFRYPPLRWGSRFGTRAERGIWYGADRLATALAEAAYYRFVFLAGTEADLEPILVDLTSFRASVSTDRGIDLTADGGSPYADAAAEISSPVSYGTSQRVGAELRAAGAAAFRFRSARDPTGGTNVGLLTPAAFSRPRPDGFETWYCVITTDAVEVSRRHAFVPSRRTRVYRFPRQVFEVDGALPAPAL